MIGGVNDAVSRTMLDVAGWGGGRGANGLVKGKREGGMVPLLVEMSEVDNTEAVLSALMPGVSTSGLGRSYQRNFLREDFD